MIDLVDRGNTVAMPNGVGADNVVIAGERIVFVWPKNGKPVPDGARSFAQHSDPCVDAGPTQ